MLVRVLLADGAEQIEVPDEEVLCFPRGVVGFEECKQYALLQLDTPLYLLQSVDDPHVGFVLMDPTLVDRNYQAPIALGDRALLQLSRAEQPLLLSIVTLPAEGGSPSINLKAPVAINTKKQLGVQVILQDMPYPVHHPLVLTADGTLDLSASGLSRTRSGRPPQDGARGRSLEVVRC